MTKKKKQKQINPYNYTNEERQIFHVLYLKQYNDQINEAPLPLVELKRRCREKMKIFLGDDTSNEKIKRIFLKLVYPELPKDLRYRSTWEAYYRKCVGTLPEERNEFGYGCINGVNVLKYFHPWRVLGLDPKYTTEEDIQLAYDKLSAIYHPDVPETGDERIFNKINIMYRSVTAKP